MNRTTYIVSSGPWHDKIKAAIEKHRESQKELNVLMEKYSIEKVYCAGGQPFRFIFKGERPAGFKKYHKGGYTFARSKEGKALREEFESIQFIDAADLQDKLGFHRFYFRDDKSCTLYFICMEPSPCGEKYKLEIPDCGDPYEVPSGVKKVDVESLIWEAGQ